MSLLLREQLKQLEMWSEDQSTGLLWVNEIEMLPPDERLIIEDAQKYHATAVYIRRFEGARSAVPQVYIYDLENQLDFSKLGKTLEKLWNFGQVPILFAFSKSEIKIFNCFQSPFNDNGEIISEPFKLIKLASQAKTHIENRKAFSGRMFDTGSFWDSPLGKKFDRNESAYVQLLNQLKIARKKFLADQILSKTITERLLILSILVKYLEDRKDINQRSVFPLDFFNQFAEGATSYYDVLRKKGACVSLFDNLSEHFNGDFFTLSENERAEFSETDLSGFAELFVSGKVEGFQFSLWKRYSFEDLPIELISNIYEEFLDEEHKKKKGAVYTPPYLVNLLIDECMPIDEPKHKFSIIDPACGSGVFLVAAYKRLIVWWRQLNNWEKPDKENLASLKELLINNIYGVDIKGSAVKLAMFSLTLALCDELSPKEIWENLRFDNLMGQNLFTEDFFEWLLRNEQHKKFDLVIGNPPFISELTDAAIRIEKSEINLGRVKVPDNQIALLFLEQTPKTVKEGGQVCLIIKAGPLLYNKGSFEFRKNLFECYQVDYIFDFTALEQVLFGGATVETAAVFLKNQAPVSDNLFHITFRRTRAAKEQVFFELDSYDVHRVKYQDALDKRLIWKANLLGGGRLHFLLERLERVRTLGNFLKPRLERKAQKWYIAEGFIIGNKNEISKLENLITKTDKNKEEEKEHYRLSKKYKEAEYLYNYPTLPTTAFTEKGIDKNAIHLLKEKFFIRSRYKNREIFSPPHLLIKEHVKEEAIPIEFRDDYLSFRDKIIGIHAPEKDKHELIGIERRIKNNRNYSFWAAALSTQYLVSRASALLKQDILSLPYPENESVIEVDEIEQIIIDDVLDFLVSFRRQGENSHALRNAQNDELLVFSKYYCKILNSVYGKFSSLPPIRIPSYIIFPFYFGEKPQVNIPNEIGIQDYLENLLISYPSQNLRINRIMRIYDHNVIYLIKPDQVRYWLKSVAIRDADETFADLVVQGY